MCRLRCGDVACRRPVRGERRVSVAGGGVTGDLRGLVVVSACGCSSRGRDVVLPFCSFYEMGGKETQ